MTVESLEHYLVEVDADLKDLIPRFLQNRQHELVEMRRFLLAQKVEDLKRLGHSLKGSAGGYGFNVLSLLGKQIEEACKCGDLATVPALLDQYELILRNVKVVYVQDAG